MNAKLVLSSVAALGISVLSSHATTSDAAPVVRPWDGQVVNVNTATSVAGPLQTDFAALIGEMAAHWTLDPENPEVINGVPHFTHFAFDLSPDPILPDVRYSTGMNYGDLNLQNGKKYLVLTAFNPIGFINATGDFNVGFVGNENGYNNLLGLDVAGTGGSDSFGLYGYKGGIDGTGEGDPKADLVVADTPGDSLDIRVWGKYDNLASGPFHMDTDPEHFFNLFGGVYDYTNAGGLVADGQNPDKYLLIGFDDEKNPNWIDFDDGVMLMKGNFVVPEPATVAGLGVLGLFGIAVLRRRVRK